MKKLAILFLVLIVLVQTAVPSTRIFASADGLVLNLSTNKSEVESGEEFSYFIDYSASSTTPNYENPSISLQLPAGVTYISKVDSQSTTSTHDGSGLVTFTFNNNELPAGSTGQLVVRGKFENYTTPDGTTAIANAEFDAIVDGSPVSRNSNDAAVTAKASASWDIKISKVTPPSDPFKGSDVQYEIKVQPESSSTGQLDIKDVELLFKIADGGNFISASNGGAMGPDNTVVWHNLSGIRGLKSVRVIVNYPSSMTATEVTSEVTLTYTPIGKDPKSVSASTTHGFETLPVDGGTAPTVSNMNGVKEISPGQDITFLVNGLENKANVHLDSGMLTMMVPADTFLKSLKSATFNGIATYDIYYTLEENPNLSDWYLWQAVNSSSYEILDATSLGSVKGILVHFGTLPTYFSQSSPFEFRYKVDSSFNISHDGSGEVSQQAQFAYNFYGEIKAVTGSSKVRVVSDRPLVQLDTTVSKTSVVPNETMTYTLSVTNHAQLSSRRLDNPVIYNILPAELEYMPGTWTVVKPLEMLDPTFTAEPTPSGETRLTWSWDDTSPGDLQIGKDIQIKFDAKIKPGTQAQIITNKFGVESPSYLNDVEYSNFKSASTVPDDGIYRVKAESNITVSESTALQSEMWVKGELDSDWSKYPSTGLTTPGGNALYRLSVVNVGNEPLKDLVIVNPFPRIGDKIVLNASVPRGSQWGPVLTGSVVAPSYVTVYYSTTSGISMNQTTGADNGVWMPSLPVDPTSVQAIKMVFDSDYVINPLNKTTLEWEMKAPVGAPNGGEIAWNSFAYKVNKVSGQSILPAEPFKVGISIQNSPKASIGDLVWLDSNENGVLDGAETGINGVIVELYDENGKLAQTVTSNDFFGKPGSYLFPNLEAGKYRVHFKPDSQYKEISSHLITIADGEQYLGLDLGIVAKKGKIGSYVWLDSNENGVQDTGESGMNGVTVELYNGTSTLLATTTTATFNGLPGHYEFNNLSPGNYQVRFVLPSGYKFTQQGVGSSVEPSTGRTAVVALAQGEEKVEMDAGLIQLATPSIGNQPADQTSPTPTPQPSTEQIVVDVVGNNGSNLTKIPIMRSTEPDGTIKDKVSMTYSIAKETVLKAKEQGVDTARIIIPDKEDKVVEVKVEISKGALDELNKGNLKLEIATLNAVISIPTTSIDNFNQDLYFRIVPIKSESEKKQIEDRAKNETLIQGKVGNNSIQVLGRPMVIETNMQSRQVSIVLPLTASLPTNPAERQKVLNNLGVFIEHSDGTKELIEGTVVKMKDGSEGFEFPVNKFSTFTMVYLEGWKDEVAESVTHTPYIEGYSNNEFRPNALVTRAQMAKMLAQNLEVPSSTKAYADVKSSHWAFDYVMEVEGAGIMTGVNQTTFNLNGNVTRAQMASIAYRWVQKQCEKDSSAYESCAKLSDIPKVGFKDVTSKHWAAEAINFTKEAGIMAGFEDNTFKPNQELTRAQAVKVINILFKRGPLTNVGTPTFKDVPKTHWAYGDVEEAAREHDIILDANR